MRLLAWATLPSDAQESLASAFPNEADVPKAARVARQDRLRREPLREQFAESRRRHPWIQTDSITRRSASCPARRRARRQFGLVRVFQ